MDMESAENVTVGLLFLALEKIWKLGTFMLCNTGLVCVLVVWNEAPL